MGVLDKIRGVLFDMEDLEYSADWALDRIETLLSANVVDAWSFHYDDEHAGAVDFCDHPFCSLHGAYVVGDM